MQCVDEALEPGQEPVVIDAQLAEAVASDPLWRAHRDRDQAYAAERPGLVVGDESVRNVALWVRQPGGHGWHDHPIGNFHPSDSHGGKENVHALALAAAPNGASARLLLACA